MVGLDRAREMLRHNGQERGSARLFFRRHDIIHSRLTEEIRIPADGRILSRYEIIDSLVLYP